MPPPHDEAAAVGRTSGAQWVIGLTNYYGGGWDGGEHTSLSDFQSINCPFVSGASDSYFLTGLTAWREKAGSLDNYVAKLTARCSEYVSDPADDRLEQTNVHKDNLAVYNGAYRDESGSSKIDTNQYLPIGVRLALNSSGTHVKDVAMLYGETGFASGNHGYIYSYANPLADNWALNYATYGNTVDVLCSDQMVASWVRVRYDTRNGKIRTFYVNCTDVWHQ